MQVNQCGIKYNPPSISEWSLSWKLEPVFHLWPFLVFFFVGLFKGWKKAKEKTHTMYSPKELEGEVDHSFFDSDCDVNGTKPGKPVRQERQDTGSSDEKLPNQAENSRTQSRMQTNETKEEKCGVETLEKELSRLEVQSRLIATDGTECKQDDQVRNKASSSQEEMKTRGESPEQKDMGEKEDSACGKEDSDTSSRKSSPLPRSDVSESSRGSKSDDSFSICSSSSSAGEEDDAVFKNEDDACHRNEISKKCVGKFRKRSHSRSSSSSGRRSPTPSGKPSNTSSTSSPRRQPRPGSATWKQRPKPSETANSDDTVTDVTPLSSPNVSPQQSFYMAPPPATESVTLETSDGQKLNVNTDRMERSGRYHG